MAKNIFVYLKKWRLAVAMVAGCCLYFGWGNLPLGLGDRGILLRIIEIAQPVLIFSMLFITFTKIDFTKLRLRWWHVEVISIQLLCFWSCFALFLSVHSQLIRLLCQVAMLCIIAPCATASSVVVARLRGDVEGLMGYSILSNLLTSLVLSVSIPYIGHTTGVDFLPTFLKLLAKVSPMVVLPIFAALVVRRFAKPFQVYIEAKQGLAFNMWALCIVFAIAMSTHGLVSRKVPLQSLILIVLVTLFCCIFQFCIGRFLGRNNRFISIASSQGFGQKNTIFLIWVGYTFMDPLCSVAGGFYTIFHNFWNSYQLVQAEKEDRHNEL